MSLIATIGTAQTVEWAGKFGGNGEDVVKKMFVDPSGNSYTTGYFTDVANFAITGTPVVLTGEGNYDVFIQKTNSSGELEWARSIGSESGEYGTAITADAMGNVYVSGVFDAPIDIDPGVGVSTLIPIGDLDIFIVKLDTDGNFIWGKSVGGDDYDESTGIGVDESGAVYLSGYFNETADFDPGAGVTEFTSNGLLDCFVAKYDASGNFVWAKHYGGSNIEVPLSLKVMNEGRCYVSGLFKQTVDFDPGAAVFSMTSNGTAPYVLVLESSGDFVRALKLTSSQSGNCYDLDVDPLGNMYLAGTFHGTVDLDPGAGNVEYTSQFDNGFIVKLTPEGEFIWGKNIESNEMIVLYSIDVNSIGNVLVSGYMESTTDFNPDSSIEFNLTPAPQNATGAFISELDVNGDFVRAAGYGGCNFIDYHAAYFDDADNLYISGAFETTVDINPNSLIEQLVATAGFRDNYLIKIKSIFAELKEEPSNLNLQIYPNPAHKNLWISTNTNNWMGEVFELVDCTGKVVKRGVFHSSHVQLDIEDLSPGVYTIKAAGEMKLVVIH